MPCIFDNTELRNDTARYPQRRAIVIGPMSHPLSCNTPGI